MAVGGAYMTGTMQNGPTSQPANLNPWSSPITQPQYTMMQANANRRRRPGATLGGINNPGVNTGTTPVGSGQPLGMLPTGGTAGGSGPTDVYGQSALGFLQRTLAGEEAPVGPAQRAARMGRATDMNAAAEGARNDQTRAAVAGGGAAMSDPSARAATRESMARRQTDNMLAGQAIDSDADERNFGAKMSAAGTLADFSQAAARERAAYLASLRSGAYDNTRGTLGMNPSTGGSGRITGYGGRDLQQTTYGGNDFGDNLDDPDTLWNESLLPSGYRY